MKALSRSSVALGILGAMAVAGNATASAEQEDGPKLEDRGVALSIAAAPGPGFHASGQMVHGERTLIDEDGNLTTMIDDAGTVTSVDGDTLTIERPDGETITAAIGDDTDVIRNGERVALSELEDGDIAHVHRIRDADGVRVIAVFAHTEGWEPEFRPRPGFRGRPHGGPFPFRDRIERGDRNAGTEETIFLG